ADPPAALGREAADRRAPPRLRLARGEPPRVHAPAAERRPRIARLAGRAPERALALEHPGARLRDRDPRGDRQGAPLLERGERRRSRERAARGRTDGRAGGGDVTSALAQSLPLAGVGRGEGAAHGRRSTPHPSPAPRAGEGALCAVEPT